MAGGTLDPDNIPARRARKTQKGHEVRSLGPSDSSDSGSDLAGRRRRDDTSDRGGTGERLTAEPEQPVQPGSDIDVNRIVGPDEAGLGRGLDEAEEARLEPEDERLGRH